MKVFMFAILVWIVAVSLIIHKAAADEKNQMVVYYCTDYGCDAHWVYSQLTLPGDKK